MAKNEKKLGLINVIGLGVGGAIGSGIFVTLGSAMSRTGRSILPITIICVFYMLLAYWYNLAMSTVFVVKGGDYSMKGMLLPPILTGFGGWTNVIWAFGCTGYALAISQYLGDLWPLFNEYSKISSAIILTIFFLLTIKGNSFVAIFQNVVTFLLIFALILFVVLGVPSVDTSKFFDMNYDGGFFYNGLSGVISAIAIMAWACQGTTMGPVGVVPNTKNPKRNIPLGIILTCLVVSAVYGLMSFVASGVLTYDQYAGENLSVTARAIMPQGLFTFFVIGGGICAIISSFLSVLIMIRYPLSKMADDGWLPNSFKKKSADGYPYYCYLLVYIVALVPILIGMNVDNAISMLMIPTMIINIYLNTKCMIIPSKYKEQFENRSIKIPKWLFVLASVLGGVCSAIIAITLFKDLNFHNAIIAAAVVIFPLLFSWLALKSGSVSRKHLDKEVEKIIEDALKHDQV